MLEKKRCSWCLDEGIMQDYHDREWGIPVHDDRKQFEFITLEIMQAGLNWKLMLKKREVFRQCFDNFDFDKIVEYGEEKIEEILLTDGMIKSRRKVEAVINNAKNFQEIIKQYGSFDKYIWGFTERKTVIYKEHQSGNIPSKNELSDEISKELKKRGFKFLGSVTVYSHLQASGIINDHVCDCFMYEDLIKKYPVIYK
ncbi:DNA-3-methyladenine glycosylase I [Clostridium sp. BL-8]|uniref:DNA-3-methyladenine glycosylase I n=1 Tax=Clostridium sp. BL-8 TaxID=349938 RepID=UPI00098C435F|nr:DNA-3-methyladenine glycosylase I [Clostridium sp. BL-8]OOM77036.1 DNA-3-methyladenine glycosylase 1 [Clostridium sp. BL-8]